MPLYQLTRQKPAVARGATDILQTRVVDIPDGDPLPPGAEPAPDGATPCDWTDVAPEGQE